jgi:drug/metabolite transporter (DMT)-like permease
VTKPAPAPVRRERLDALAIGVLLACCVVWGVLQVAAKATIPEIAPVWQASLRFAGATVLLLAWSRWRGIALWQRDGSLGWGLVCGTLFAVEFALLFVGLQRTSASRLTLFLYTSPFWVAALLPLWVRAERLSTAQWAGLVLAFAAVVGALALRPDTVTTSVWGDVLALLAGLFWGLTTVAIRASGLARIGAEKLLLYQVATTALVLPFVSLALGEAWSLPWQGAGWSTLAWASIVAQTAFGAFASYLAWMWLLAHYPATRVSGFVFLVPVVALLTGAAWLGEPITWAMLASLGLIATGIWLINRRP